MVQDWAGREGKVQDRTRQSRVEEVIAGQGREGQGGTMRAKVGQRGGGTGIARANQPVDCIASLPVGESCGE